MAKSVQTLANEIFTECAKNGEPVTKAEAFEMAKMEFNAKADKNYTITEKVAKKGNGTRTPKIDKDKETLIHYIYTGMNIRTDLENLTVKNAQKEVTFTYNGSEYSINLVKHRPPKDA